jgi:hypothetical protein
MVQNETVLVRVTLHLQWGKCHYLIPEKPSYGSLTVTTAVQDIPLLVPKFSLSTFKFSFLRFVLIC